ncbi:hypothetical protein BLOT_015458 [Blomia tropicalis]|nr:hypothetical protein BLOT_015458 [Blomia tropicalis]
MYVFLSSNSVNDVDDILFDSQNGSSSILRLQLYKQSDKNHDIKKMKNENQDLVVHKIYEKIQADLKEAQWFEFFNIHGGLIFEIVIQIEI